MCDKLRIPRRPPSIFGARRGEIQDDLDPVSISAPTSWCASVVPCSVTAAMLTSRFGPICSIAPGSSKEMDRQCQLPSRASGSSSSLMAVRYTEPIRNLSRCGALACDGKHGSIIPGPGRVRLRNNRACNRNQTRKKSSREQSAITYPERKQRTRDRCRLRDCHPTAECVKSVSAHH